MQARPGSWQDGCGWITSTWTATTSRRIRKARRSSTSAPSTSSRCSATPPCVSIACADGSAVAEAVERPHASDPVAPADLLPFRLRTRVIAHRHLDDPLPHRQHLGGDLVIELEAAGGQRE